MAKNKVDERHQPKSLTTAQQLVVQQLIGKFGEQHTNVKRVELKKASIDKSRREDDKRYDHCPVKRSSDTSGLINPTGVALVGRLYHANTCKSVDTSAD